MPIDSNSHLPTGAGMSAEAGFDGSDIQAPIRVSGFICLLLGLISALSFLAPAMLIVPFLATGFGFFALRRYGVPKPVGIKAAYIGLILAIGFGMFGLGVPLFKKHTLGTQAEYFAKEYLKIVASGDDYYAMELRKDYVNRFMRSMPLAEHYETSENAKQTLEEYRDDSVRKMLMRAGPDAEWELDRSIRVYHSYGNDHADVVLVNYDEDSPRRIRVILQGQISTDGEIQWHVETFMMYRERLVAESIL